MARSIRQIQQELEQIKESVTESAQELQALYDNYIACLSESAQKQLILAGYQLCTQIYPEAFLAMSLNQRQKLQQSLRKLGQEMKPLLTKKPTAEELTQEQSDLNLIAEMLQNLPLSRAKDPKQDPEESPKNEDSNNNLLEDETLDSATTIMLEQEDDLVAEEIQEFSWDRLQDLANQQSNVPQIEEIDLSNPHHLILWHKRVETRIRKTLDDASRKANKYLQEFNIIPSRLPSKVIDVAIVAGESNSSNGKLRSVPNILNLIVETDKKQKAKKLNAAHISLLRLRLSEIEFADAKLSSQRNEIRTLLKKIQQLGSWDKEKKHEYAKAEADAVWRSSWYED